MENSLEQHIKRGYVVPVEGEDEDEKEPGKRTQKNQYRRETCNEKECNN